MTWKYDPEVDKSKKLKKSRTLEVQNILQAPFVKDDVNNHMQN